MAYLYPWPRDFRQGVFKYRTTPPGSIPLDKDIERTIARGVPGTAMPAWGGALTENEISGVVEYIKTFSKNDMKIDTYLALFNVQLLQGKTDDSRGKTDVQTYRTTRPSFQKIQNLSSIIFIFVNNVRFPY